MITRWSILIAVYAVWMLIAALADILFKNPNWYDYSYWICERIFVLLTFLTLGAYIEKKYRWVMHIMVVVATGKLLYINLMIGGVIRVNSFLNVMALIFLLAIGIIIVKWPK